MPTNLPNLGRCMEPKHSYIRALQGECGEKSRMIEMSGFCRKIDAFLCLSPGLSLSDARKWRQTKQKGSMPNAKCEWGSQYNTLTNFIVFTA